ncbi:TIGR03086 family metal-binding protein [Actinomadura vinacea]|uniref:TIGR03086 family metal-binding protein n=1 Tax=Actinomadura vinacea TaxID=115336 RepID=A0ABN3K4E0_9ACTN
MIDLTPAARRTAALLAAVPDDALGARTPCGEYTLGDLVDHVGGLALAFTWAAAKDARTALSAQGPSGDAARLESGWQKLYPERLDALAAAWRAPDAWTGMTQAGGVDLPGEVAGLVALDELVVHGWDIARATDRPYDVPQEEIDACLEFVSQAQSGPEPGPFGAAVPVPPEAPALDRLIGLTGRDPFWTP